nr:protein FANTASTIC FOUR 1 [Ipomoea batatas]
MHCVELGEYVGVESCFDSVGADMESGLMSRRVHRGEGRREKGAMKAKEFPPPLPWLARTGNSPASRMPWILKRRYTEDGRLIITGEKTERHEYFEAHRSDGRLRLRLVPMDVLVGGEPSANDPDEGAEEEEEEMHGGDHHQIDGGCDGDVAVCDGGDAGGGDDPIAAALEDPRSATANAGSLITDACGGGGNKCSNSFIFSLAVTAIPPVHTQKLINSSVSGMHIEKSIWAAPCKTERRYIYTAQPIKLTWASTEPNNST